MCGMRAALFNFFAKRERHRSAFLSKFDPQARKHGTRQPLRIAFRGGSAKFDHPVGENFAHAVGIVRAMQHPEDRVESVAQEFTKTPPTTAIAPPALGYFHGVYQTCR
jgi:hypothetical protein